jgi:hypothetical protein
MSDVDTAELIDQMEEMLVKYKEGWAALPWIPLFRDAITALTEQESE